MKRRSTVILLCVCMCLLLAACQKNSKPAEETAAEQAAEEPAAEEPVPEIEDEEEPAAEEPTPEVVEKPEAVTPSGELSDDLYSFQIQAGDTVYQFPMRYSEFEALGWTYDGDTDMTLEPNQYTMSDVWKKDGIRCYTDIANLGQDVMPVTDCIVASITLENYYLKDQMTFIMPGGITYMVSSQEDIIAAYGEPTSMYEGDISNTLTYNYASYRDIKFKIENEIGVLTEVKVRNMVELEDSSVSVSAEVSDEVPEVVGMYKAPEELGNDFSTYNVEYAGALYSLPAPVAEFEKNGWKIINEESSDTVVAQGFGWITLMKNNQRIRVIANNYSDKATAINNCFVTKVEAGDNIADLNIVIPGGITRGDGEADLLKAIKGQTYESSEGSSYTTYEVYVEKKSNSYDITVKDGKIIKITVQNSPKYKDLFK